MRYVGAMARRTTLSIDDDVFAAAKALAANQRKSVGQVISELARKSLADQPPLKTRNGIPQLPRKHPFPVVTLEFVNALRDDEE
jgi:hypothetical protein